MKKTLLKKLALIFCVCLLFTAGTVYAEEASDNASSTEKETQTPEETPEEIPEETREPLILSSSMSATKTALLEWNAEDADATYELLRATSKAGTYSTITTVTDKTGTVSYKDTNRTLGSTYYYKVQMSKEGTVIETSNIASVYVRLKTPTNVKVTRTSDNDLKISWSKVSYATRYSIYRSTKKDGEYERLGSTTSTSYTDTTPLTAKRYYYKVYAYKTPSPTARSLPSDVKIGYTRPNAPLVTTSCTTSGYVKLSWKKVTRATKYHIYRMNSNGEYKQIGTTTNLSYTDKTAKLSTRYKYRVKASYTSDSKTILSYYKKTQIIYTAKINPNKKMVALTFDDGPGIYTKEIVDCLKKYDSRATFFVVGSRVNTYSDALKYSYDNGNEIANHTYSHPTLTRLSTSRIKSEVSKTDNAIKNITGESTKLMRAPGGATNSTVRNAISKPFIYWSIDTLDWKHRNSAKTVSTVMNNVSDGDIILMHDIHSPTKTAALQLIPKLKAAGYQLVTVSELAQYRGYNLQNGTTYYSLD